MRRRLIDLALWCISIAVWGLVFAMFWYAVGVR